MKKILFLISEISNSGGAERVITNLSNYFAKKNYSVILTSANYGLPAYNLESDVEIKYLDEEIKEYQNKYLKKIKKQIKLRKIIKTYKPDLVIAFLPYEIYRTLLLKLICRFRLIVSFREAPSTQYNTFAKKVFMRIFLPLSDGIVFQTEEAGAFFRFLKQDNYAIIPNPLNQTFLNLDCRRINHNKIVTVGRLESQKNQKLIIDAFSKLDDNYDDYFLEIYGEGPFRTQLQDCINEKHLNNRVFLKGNVTDVKQNIYDASLFILSSNHEGMPNALMEAMALGIPVISTDCPCGGPKYLIQNGYNGLLIPVNDSDALHHAMEKVLNFKEFSQKLGENALQIRVDLNPDKINRNWEKYMIRVGEKL